MGVDEWWPERRGNPKNKRLGSFWGWVVTGGGWWVSMSGGQKDVATLKTSGYAHFGVGWWWVVGVDRWLWLERHWVVVVVVAKKKKGSPKTSEALVFGLVVMAGG